MPIARPQTPCWTPRAAEAEFLRLLSAQQAKIFPLTGGGSIGKTSLLIWCFEYCQNTGKSSQASPREAANWKAFPPCTLTCHATQRTFSRLANTAVELLQKYHGLDQNSAKSWAQQLVCS